MLFTVESRVLDAALKLVASLPDTDEHTVAAAAMAMLAAGHACERIAAYDVVESRLDTNDAAHHVTLRHRRTGRTTVAVGTVNGEGPSLEVMLRESGSSEEKMRVVGLHEMPEAIATILLRPHVLDADALTR